MDGWLDGCVDGNGQGCVNCFHIHDHLDMCVCTLQIYYSVRPKWYPQPLPHFPCPFINTHPRDSFPWIQNVTNIDPWNQTLASPFSIGNMNFYAILTDFGVLYVKCRSLYNKRI